MTIPASPAAALHETGCCLCGGYPNGAPIDNPDVYANPCAPYCVDCWERYGGKCAKVDAEITRRKSLTPPAKPPDVGFKPGDRVRWSFPSLPGIGSGSGRIVAPNKFGAWLVRADDGRGDREHNGETVWCFGGSDLSPAIPAREAPLILGIDPASGPDRTVMTWHCVRCRRVMTREGSAAPTEAEFTCGECAANADPYQKVRDGHDNANKYTPHGDGRLRDERMVALSQSANQLDRLAARRSAQKAAWHEDFDKPRTWVNRMGIEVCWTGKVKR